MSSPYKIVHCLNQFFGGVGGEEKASIAPSLLEGPKGPGILLQKLFPAYEVTATIVFGDNYMAEHTDRGVQEVLDLLAPLLEISNTAKPVMLLAGPAFNAGRYGLACGAICKAAANRYKIKVAASMFPNNPAVNEYRRVVYIAKAGEDVISMHESLKRLGDLGLKMLKGEKIFPQTDEYISRGIRQNYFHDKTGAERAIDMLLKKLKGEAFDTEYPMPTFDRVVPAAAVTDLKRTTLAIVTSGGIVPKGNPDKIAAANAQRFGRYLIKGISAFASQSHQTAHGGYDPTFANENPNRVLPLDVMRELEAEGVIGRLHDYYYATVGNATSVANARRFGESIAKQLTSEGVQAVILTST